jgi:hypothetical protein
MLRRKKKKEKRKKKTEHILGSQTKAESADKISFSLEKSK